jgi:hypothetical protein
MMLGIRAVGGMACLKVNRWTSLRQGSMSAGVPPTGTKALDLVGAVGVGNRWCDGGPGAIGLCEFGDEVFGAG